MTLSACPVSFRPVLGLNVTACQLQNLPVPPRIRPFAFESAVYAGEPVQLTCLVTKGDRPLRISWYLQSVELTGSQTGVTTNNLGDAANSLSVSSASTVNRGNYTCVAQNAVGADSYSAYLEVNGTPSHAHTRTACRIVRACFYFIKKALFPSTSFY